MGIDEYIDLALDAGYFQRFNSLCRPVKTREIVVNFSVVDKELTVAFADAYSGDSVLSSACTPNKGYGGRCFFFLD